MRISGAEPSSVIKTSLLQLDFKSLSQNPYLVPALAQSFGMIHVVI